MPFTAYKNIVDVFKEYQISSKKANFIVDTPLAISPYFREDVDFTIRNFTFDENEYVAGEMIIFPVLKEVYKHYLDRLNLWSHKGINYNEKLSGIPDYILAQVSVLGREIFDRPFFATVEAKKDDFSLGWAQCLAQLIAMQKINNLSQDHTVFGIVSNGLVWQFGKLTGNTFTKEIKAYIISDLDKLMSAVNYIFAQCQQEIDKLEVNQI